MLRSVKILMHLCITNTDGPNIAKSGLGFQGLTGQKSSGTGLCSSGGLVIKGQSSLNCKFHFLCTNKLRGFNVPVGKFVLDSVSQLQNQ